MANVMSMKSVRNNPTSSGFDLSRRRAFTAKAGQVEVLFAEEILPGDHTYDLRTQWMSRTQPLNTAAFTRMREYVDWYFVPNNLLWNNFNTWRYKMDRNVQHAITPTGQVYLSDEHPTFTSAGIIDYLRRVDASAQKNNIFGYNRAQLTCKLLHMLGYGDYYDFASESPRLQVNNVKLSPWKLLAYQKVYADYIRDSQWEQAYSPSFNIDYMSNHTYNNNIPISQMGTTNIAGLDSETMFDMRYCNWPKDTFMGVLPNSQYGSPATVISWNDYNKEITLPILVNAADGGTLNDGVNLTTNSVLSSAGSNLVDAGGYNLNLKIQEQSLRDSIRSAFSVLSLRQAEAAQKFAEVSQASPQDAKAQAEAHWNVSMSDAYSDRCKWLGGITNNIDINEVVNTNITGFNDAAIAGKGIGVANGKLNFKSDVDGVLIAIYRCVPILDYALSGIRKANLKSKVTDYAIPEFDKTGMVQVPLIEMTSRGSSGFTSGFLGYAPAYYEYKTAIDDVCGAFYNGGTDLESWVAPVSDEYLNQYLQSVGGGTLALTYTFFKVNPNILNPIFGVNANDSVDTDQFLINSYVEFKPVRKLDYDGLPY